MQQGFFLLTTCDLKNILDLNKLDCFSLLLAGVCHDLGHDGFNNTFHVNSVSSRAIDSNDGAVQEIYHVAEMFRLVTQDKLNFLKNLRREEFMIFRKRVIGLILATDMANHAGHLSSLKNIISEHEIEKGKNVQKWI